MKNSTDAKLSPQLMDLGLRCALEEFSNTLSIQLLRNEQLNCSIEQVQVMDNGLKNIHEMAANGHSHLGKPDLR